MSNVEAADIFRRHVSPRHAKGRIICPTEIPFEFASTLLVSASSELTDIDCCLAVMPTEIQEKLDATRWKSRRNQL